MVLLLHTKPRQIEAKGGMRARCFSYNIVNGGGGDCGTAGSI
jgi:hypothetical protein